MNISIVEHHRSTRHPYYVTAPGFSEHSSGIRVLHYLCHILNHHGYESYIHSPSTSDNLWTPKLTDDVMKRHFFSKRKPIAIYPEVVRGTPLGIGLKVRFLLNIPGKIAGHAEFDHDEITFGYRPAFIVDPKTPILTVPTSDPELFFPGLPQENRHGRYFFFNRLLARGGELQPMTDDAVEISPRQPKSMSELAEIFKKAELLYCYEDGAITLEARMCGCPIVYVPNPTFLPSFPPDDWGRLGAAWGDSPEEIKHAKDTVGEAYKLALSLYDEFGRQLNAFIETTQSAAEKLSFEDCYPPSTVYDRGWNDSPEEQAAKLKIAKQKEKYNLWQKTQHLTEPDAVILAERLMTQSTHRPAIQIFVASSDHQDSALKQTIQSLESQLYPDLKITVVSDQPPPPEWQEKSKRQWLALKEASYIDYVVDEMATVSSSDWLARIDAGVTLTPEAILLMADLIQRQPQLRVIYSDEDILRENLSLDSPIFRPEFDENLLRANNYLGSFVLFQKDAFIEAGRFGRHAGAQNFDLALRVFDLKGAQAFSHLPRVVVHAQERSKSDQELMAEEAALLEHFQRNNTHFYIQPGIYTGTRRLTPLKTPILSVSVLLPVNDELDLVHPLLNDLRQSSVLEVLVIQTGNGDPDTQAFLRREAISPAWNGRLKIHQSNTTDWASKAAEMANGDLLYFTEPHLSAPTAAQLDELASMVELNGIAAVAPRVLFSPQTHNVVLNAEYSLAPEFATPHLAPSAVDPGLSGQYMCMHRKLAVDRFPILVRRHVYVASGGLDLANLTLSDAVIDLCARMSRDGHDLVWTPNVSIERVDLVSFPDLQTNKTWAEKSRLTLLTRHIHRLASDPCQHWLWSMDRPEEFEHQIPMAWTQSPQDKPRIMFLFTDGEPQKEPVFFTAVDRWRRNAEAQFVFIDLRSAPLSVLTIAKLKPDAVVLHATESTVVQKLLYDMAHCLPDIPRIMRVDNLDFLPYRHGQDNLDSRPALRRALRYATRVVTQTEEMASLCRDLTPDLRSVTISEATRACDWF